MFKLTVLLIQLAAITCNAFWDLNDVSYLMPLPKEIGTDHLLKADSNSGKGNLLPATYYEALPRLTTELTPQEIKNNLRAIAVRIDPCFTMPSPEKCQKQIRIVWQILRKDSKQQIETIDAAYHSFYVLTDDQFNQLTDNLIAWKHKYAVPTKGLPLQVHPAWKTNDKQIVSLIDFNNIILKFASEQNISRITAMTVRNLGQTWGFIGADILNQKLAILEIPRVHSNAQIFVNQSNPATEFLGQISPQPVGTDTLNHLISNSKLLKTENEQTIKDELSAIYRIENPHAFNPNTMDCVSCHTAGIAKEWLKKNRADLDTTDIFFKYAYTQSAYNLNNTSDNLNNTQNIRAFGYYQKTTAISQRTINESAEVANFLNSFLGN
ncbi:MAG: hypothetical protein WA160_04315 [Pseudobdellovibrio sp.]